MEISEPQSPSQSGEPHEALILALSYFPVLELLAASEACSSLRDAVKNDVVPWLNVVVERPLSKRLSDETLIRIASMARGKLRTLSLIHCVNVTDDALQLVVETNPLINKLLIPGCTRLTPEGVIRAVKTLLSKQGHTLTTLHINGIYNIQNHHLQSLQSHLQPYTSPQNQRPNRPVIDLEICPRCDEPRLVFNCPREICQAKTELSCRGCEACIERCKECGVCVNESSEELGEAVCGDVLCLNCWLRLPKCSFCNRPYCGRHAEEEKCRSGLPGPSGFVCDVCRAKYVEGLYFE